VCDLTKTIIQSSRPTDPVRAIRDEPNIKSLRRAESAERHKEEGGREGGRERERREGEDKWDRLMGKWES